MKRIDTMRMRPEEVRLALARPALHEVEVSKEAAEKTRQVFGEALTPAESVERILSDVEAYGDAAVVDYAERFDGVRLEPAELFLSEEACQAAREACDPAVMEAVREALASIERFHRRQLRRDWFSAEQDGSWVGPVPPLGASGLLCAGGPVPAGLHRPHDPRARPAGGRGRDHHVHALRSGGAGEPLFDRRRLGGGGAPHPPGGRAPCHRRPGRRHRARAQSR